LKIHASSPEKNSLPMLTLSFAEKMWLLPKKTLQGRARLEQRGKAKLTGLFSAQGNNDFLLPIEKLVQIKASFFQ
jgi:hypothetical protein